MAERGFLTIAFDPSFTGESGRWLDGNRFSGSVSEDDLKSWISGLDI